MVEMWDFWMAETMEYEEAYEKAVLKDNALAELKVDWLVSSSVDKKDDKWADEMVYSSVFLLVERKVDS